MKSVICLIGLMLVGCGGSGGGYTACQYESGGQMQDTTTGVRYYVDGLSCTFRSQDVPGAQCGTVATITPSALSYGPVSLAMNVTASQPKAGCFPVGQYACQRTFQGNGVAYACGAQGDFRFQYVK